MALLAGVLLMSAGCDDTFWGEDDFLSFRSELVGPHLVDGFDPADHAVAVGSEFDVVVAGARVLDGEDAALLQVTTGVREVVPSIEAGAEPRVSLSADDVEAGGRFAITGAGSIGLSFAAERKVVRDGVETWEPAADRFTLDAREVAGGAFSDPAWVALHSGALPVDVTLVAGAFPPPLAHSFGLVPNTDFAAAALLVDDGDAPLAHAGGPWHVVHTHQDLLVEPRGRSAYLWFNIADTGLEDGPREVAIQWGERPLFTVDVTAVRPENITDIQLSIFHIELDRNYVVFATAHDDQGLRVMQAPLVWDLPAALNDTTAEAFEADDAMWRTDVRILQLPGPYPVNGAQYEIFARVGETTGEVVLDLPGRPRLSPWNEKDPVKGDPGLLVSKVAPAGCSASHAGRTSTRGGLLFVGVVALCTARRRRARTSRK